MTARPSPCRAIKPSGWGFSTTLPPSLTARELHLDIDSYAGTELTAFDGNPATVEHLKYDVTNVVHYLRPSSDVVVVGTGGGRDILSALVAHTAWHEEQSVELAVRLTGAQLLAVDEEVLERRHDESP